MIPRNLVFGIVAMILIAGGMGYYAWHMRARAIRVPPAASTAPLTPPVSGPTEQVTIYVAHDDQASLRAQGFRIPLPSGRQQRAEELLRDLIGLYEGKSSPHPLGAASELKSVYLVEPGLAVVDLNGAFASGHPSGVLVEDLTVASLIETLAANVQGITRVKILVEGKSRDSLAGHADLTGFYDVNAIHQLAEELEAQ